MTLTELQTALKRYGFDDSDPLTTWLNAALHDYEDAYSWPFLDVEVENIAVAAGVESLTVPADFFKPITLSDITESTNERKLTPRTRQWWEENIGNKATQGSPENYTQIGLSTVQLWPVPDKTRTFRLVYQKQLTDLSAGTDVPGIPLRHHYYLVLRAASIGLMAENEEDRARTAQLEYEGLLDRAITKYTTRQLDEFQTVQDAMDYMEIH